MNRYSEKGSLDTRDVVARATDSELKRSGDSHVLLVTEHLDVQEIRQEFPTIANKLAEYGIDLGPDPIPVRPAAHYLVGGITVDQKGRAMHEGQLLPGLYCVGEVARTDFMVLTASLQIPYLRRWYTLRERLLTLFPEQKMDCFRTSLKISFTGEGKNLRN